VPPMPSTAGALVVAHRGRCGDLPENAVEALASLPPWVGAVEVDVRTTRDGTPVLLHDPTVDRTTSGSGAVASMPTDEVLALPRPGGVRVPTLADYLRGCDERGIATILLDLKAPRGDDLPTIVEVARASPVSGRCVFLVRRHADLRTLRSLGDELRLGLFGATRDALDAHLEAAAGAAAEVVFVRHGDRAYLANRAVVPRIRARGLAAGASTINAAETLAAAVDDGCALLLTDVADQLAPRGPQGH
jgi:glycerophosphoryl diester phosphodiesterase